MSLYDKYQKILRQALNEDEDFSIDKKLQQLISTKEIENIDLAYQLAKGQNATKTFENILYHTFVPNSLQTQFEADVKPIKEFLNRPLSEILSDTDDETLYNLGNELNNNGRDNFAEYRAFFRDEIHDKVGYDAEYDSILSKIDNDLDEINSKYQRYVNGSSMMFTDLRNVRKGYNMFKNY
jgi:hypothetical protein